MVTFFHFIWLNLVPTKKFRPLASLQLPKKFSVVGGGHLEGDFSVSFGPKLPFRLRIWTWTKLNKNDKMCQFLGPDIIKWVSIVPEHRK